MKKSLVFKIVFLVILLVNNSSWAQRKVETAPGGGILDKIAPGEGAAATRPPDATAAQIQADNQRASQYIKSYEQFAAENANSPVLSAARAEVQIIPKCAVAKNGGRFTIGADRPAFCPGHPLSQFGSPQLQEGSTPLLTPAAGMCAARPCSGVLAQNAQTILSVGHCTDGKTTEDFCNQFVFVFNRVGGKTSFSSDEVFECEGGVAVDGTRTVANFDTHSKGNIQDHAAFRLKRAVPPATAEPLQWRSSSSPTKISESLHAIGHPYGAPRMISTLTQPHRLGGGEYSYVQTEGYVYRGNSGGPLVDSKGRLVGLMASVDDTRHGDADDREPLVVPPDGARACRTQKASGPVRIEAVGAGSRFDEAIRQVQTSPTGEEEIPMSAPAARER